MKLRLRASSPWAPALACFLLVTTHVNALATSHHARLNCSRPHADLRALLTDPARGWSANTTVLFPDAPGFEAATERWTIYRPPTFRAVIRPGGEDDVVKAVRLAAAHRIPFLARGAGHGYSPTLGDFKNGLSLDLSQFRDLAVDRDAQTLTIGPGVTFKDIFDPLFEAGLQIQTGTCSCPSMIGVTLGGGIGRLQGEHGLLLDALVSVRMVTAKGQLIEVSKDSHPDLFWGVRGAGANFGVVTSATYKAHPLINGGNVLNADLYFPANMSAEYFKAVELYNDKLPARLASVTFIVWDNATSQTQVAANWVYFGTEEQGRKALAPILALKPPSASISSVPSNKLTTKSGGNYDAVVCRGNAVRSIYGLNQKNYSAAAYQRGFEMMAEYFAQYPGGRESALSYEWFPIRLLQPCQTTRQPFPGETRQDTFPNFSWAAGDEATAEASTKLGLELRDELARTAGYGRRSVFVNYARGDEGLENIYGKDKLPRLVRLKKEWDPRNTFAYYHPLPTRMYT